jgi:hypothetical protein
VGGVVIGANSFFRATVKSGHIGFCTGLIDKNEPVYVEFSLLGNPFIASELYIFPPLLAGVKRFF